MAKIVTSARGEKVDFDLMSIKSAMSAQPADIRVKERERFIHKKRRRGVKRRVDAMLEQKQSIPSKESSREEPLLDVENDVDDTDNQTAKPRRKIKNDV